MKPRPTIPRGGPEPWLGVSALILVDFKDNLDSFTALRLQKAVYLMGILFPNKFFRFSASDRGPYSSRIDMLSRRIREFQRCHGTTSNAEVRQILCERLSSRPTDALLLSIMPAMIASCDFVDSVASDDDLVLLTKLCFTVQNGGPLTKDEVLRGFRRTSAYTENRLSRGLDVLQSEGFIVKSPYGYTVAPGIP